MGEHSKLGERNTPQPARRVLAAVVPVLGLAAVIVGCVLAWNGLEANIGWFPQSPRRNRRKRTKSPESSQRAGSFPAISTQIR
ncbi:hypothetical protein AB4Y87_04150 [Paenarthrobacter sp. RAF54_2]|uniref:hypothetical protein n=1 Tax=Paenarthrobacter sp. RAF54_2 TaxID=3233061 RepID=UPI003F9CC508